MFFIASVIQNLGALKRVLLALVTSKDLQVLYLLRLVRGYSLFKAGQGVFLGAVANVNLFVKINVFLGFMLDYSDSVCEGKSHTAISEPRASLALVLPLRYCPSP